MSAGSLAVRISSAIASASPVDYAKAVPFPYAVIDGAIPEDLARTVADSFPPAQWHGWKLHSNENTIKRNCSVLKMMPFGAVMVLVAFLDRAVMRALEVLTGSRGLMFDESYEGGGMHRIDRGGFLGIHADFNYHYSRPWRRAINCLLYLEESEGGDLELWDESLTEAKATIPTAPGRLVVFTAGETTYHGHPKPLVSDTHRSLAVYYYVPMLSGAKPTRHTTIYHPAGRAM